MKSKISIIKEFKSDPADDLFKEFFSFEEEFHIITSSVKRTINITLPKYQNLVLYYTKNHFKFKGYNDK